MKLSEGATSYLAHRTIAALKEVGARVRNEKIALAQVKKSLARHLERVARPGPRSIR